LDIFLYVSSI